MTARNATSVATFAPPAATNNPRTRTPCTHWRGNTAIGRTLLAGAAGAAIAVSMGGCPGDPSAADSIAAEARAATSVGGNAGAPSSANGNGSTSTTSGPSFSGISAGSAGTAAGDAGRPADTTGSDHQHSGPQPTDSLEPTTPKPLPAGPLTIVTLGDSLTEGSGDESDQGGGYPFRVQRALQDSRAGTSVLNFGHSGWTSTDLINGFDGAPSELEQAVAANADIACVWIGSNDLWHLYAYSPEEGATPAMEAENLNAFAANIDTILSRLKASGAVVFIGLSDDQSRRPAAGTAIWGISADELTMMSAQVSRYNDVMAAAARRYGATVVDFFHTTLFTDAATLDPDGIHPNAAGYDLVAAKWLAAMQPALR